MTRVEFSVNGFSKVVEADPDMPLLWVLRDVLGLTGTKFGCGEGVCGACTLHLNGLAVRACQTPIKDVAGKTVTTIEGLSKDGSHPVQKAWIEEDVAQCGYCQPGQIMQAAWLLSNHLHPTDAMINEVMADNLCRCGTYNRIRCAIHRAAGDAPAIGKEA